jgi:CRP/FNR family transcriptional regulator, cyclic AMP receptor protein
VNALADELTAHRFFVGMDAAHLEVLTGCGRNVVIRAGTSIIREGEPADAFWALRAGRVALGVTVPGRTMPTLDTLHAGDVLGWAWLFPPYRWHFDADALDEVHAVVFDAVCLRGKCDADPALGFDLAKRVCGVLGDRLHAARMRLMDLYGPPDGR